MKKNILLFLILGLSILTIQAQNTFRISGEVRDEDNKAPITGANIQLPAIGKTLQTDEKGRFELEKLTQNEYKGIISSLGYETITQTIRCNQHIIIYLRPISVTLNEIIVSDFHHRESTLHTQRLSKRDLLQNNSSSFAKTLSHLSGIASMDIGAGFSKPIIRGLGFNRVAVIDKGIIQQGQQWGADHGLEVDQYDVDEVVVHKGPMSLQFGSDAMGGAIEIVQSKTPIESVYISDVTTVYKSNNDLWGISAMNAVKHGKWYVKARYTYQRYSDYRLPTDSIRYLNTDLPIYNKRVKNTAGKEQNVSGVIQFTTNKIQSTLNVSNVYQKNGFFPGAHGAVNLDRLQHDGSYRNIDMPNNTVNHFKVSNTTSIHLSDKIEWLTDIGYQNNHRKEHSYFHTHYDNQEPPSVNPNLELDFRLHTTTLNTKVTQRISENLTNTIGAQSSFQQNRIGGYNYLLPKYDQYTVGVYWLSNYKLNRQWSLSGGIRYDYSKMDITGFYDQVLAEFLQMQGYNQTEIDKYAQRAYNIDPHFSSFTAAVGTRYESDRNQNWKLNIGKSFRFPTANELASNGVHHGAFRHEQGNPDLKAEQGYQLDIDYELRNEIFTLNVSPFVSYFTNYIYLEPQSRWSVLPHTGQVYSYNETKAIFAGGEYKLNLTLHDNVELLTQAQYVYNRNQTDKYPLPFTPPLSMLSKITYANKYRFIQHYDIGIEHQFYAKQTRVARNEEVTGSTQLFNIVSNADLLIDKFRFSVGFQIQNLFNRRYMNHLSFYRKLEMPESGRNIQVLFKIPFYK